MRCFRCQLAITILILIAGCAAQNSYRDGEAYMHRGDYDRAVQAFEEAAEGDPKNARYSEALAQAKAEAAAAHLQDGRNHLASRSLSDARREANLALRFEPSDANAQALLEEVDSDIERAKAKRAGAMRLRQSKAWDDAIAAMEEAVSIDRSLRNGRSDLTSIRSSASESYVTLARASLRNNALREAEQHAQAALSYDRSSRAASQVLETITDRRRAAEILASSQTHIDRGEFERALKDLATADRLFPDHEPILRAIDVCKTSLGDKYAALYAKHQTEEGWGNALVYSLLANAYVPDRVPTSQIGECIDHLYDRLAYRVAIVGYRPQTEQLGPIAEALTTATAQHVLANKPENVSIIERADLEAIVAEQELTLSDLFDPDFAVPPGKLRGVNALIVGQVIEGSVTTSREQLTGVSQYQSGTRWVENPGYGFAQMSRDIVARNVRNMETDLANEQRSLESVYRAPSSPQRNEFIRFAQRAIREKARRLESARATLAAEEQRLSQVPRQVEERVISNHRYPIEKVTKTGRVRFSFKMMDTELGELLVAEVLHGEYATADRQVQPDPMHNVSGDPLQIDDDDAVLARALDDAMQAVEEPARRAVESHGTRFLILGRRAMRGNQDDAAVENFVNYLFAYPANGEQHKEVLNALNSLVPHDGELVSLANELKRVLPDRPRRLRRLNHMPRQRTLNVLAWRVAAPLIATTVGMLESAQDARPGVSVPDEESGVIRFRFGAFPYFNDGGHGRDYRTRWRLGELTAYVIRLFPEKYLSEHHPSRFEGLRNAGFAEPTVISSFEYGSITVNSARQLEDPRTRTAVATHLADNNALEIVLPSSSLPSSIRLTVPAGTYYVEYSLEFRKARLQHEHVHPNYPSIGSDDRDLRWGPPRVDVGASANVDLYVQPSHNVNFYKYGDGDDPAYTNSRAFREFKKYLHSTGEWKEPKADDAVHDAVGGSGRTGDIKVSTSGGMFTVSGHVRDEDGEPAEGYVVGTLFINQAKIMFAESKDTGRFAAIRAFGEFEKKFDFSQLGHGRYVIELYGQRRGSDDPDAVRGADSKGGYDVGEDYLYERLDVAEGTF